MNRQVAVLLGALLVAVALAGVPGFERQMAVQESLSRMPARFHAEWLQKRGLDASRYTEYHRPESTGLRLVGKYGRGPSNEVTGRGNLVALTLGSEVALLNVAKPDSPVVLSEIQLSFVPVQSALHDSFLLTGGNGIEVWNIADSTHPVFRNVIPYAVSDFAIFDTCLYFSSAGTFYAYSIANTPNPRQLGTCTDSGNVMAATRNVAVAREPSSFDLSFIDVSNPAVPKWAGAYGTTCLGVDARGNICVAAKWVNGTPDEFWVDVLDISNPASPLLLGEADSVGGYDIHLSGPLAFASGFYVDYGFAILDISDSTRPRVISQTMTPNDRFAVWADWTSNRAYVADAMGLAIVNISNINSPAYDTTVMSAHHANDVWLDQGRAYVADGGAGMRILDVTDPSMPVDLGGIDTANIHAFDTRSVVGRDSFAYIAWFTSPPLRSIDVTDPSRPIAVGGCTIFNSAEDMVLRDSLLYIAEYARFQIVNVARPRQPALVGSCVLGDESYGLSLVDSLAYVASYPFAIINVKDPAHPAIIGTIAQGAWNGSVRDTFLFLSTGNVLVYSISDPTQPRFVDSINLGANTFWVEAVDTLLYTGNSDGVHVVDARDVHDMRELAFTPTPDFVNRLTYVFPHIYAACYDAGVCIFDTAVTGIAESPTALATERQVRVLGSVTQGRVTIEFSVPARKEVCLQVFDVTGKSVGRADVPTLRQGTTRYQLDLTREPAGVYSVRLNVGDRAYHLRVIKLQQRR